MMKKDEDFNVLNKLAKNHSIVLFGSTTAAEVPINELVQDYDISQPIYNRSIAGLKLMETESHLESCLYHLNPDKVIFNLGEEDLNGDVPVSKLIEQYRWLLYKIHTVLPDTTFILTSVCSDMWQTEKFNQALHALADEYGCEFLELPLEDKKEISGLKFFRAIKSVFFENNMSFTNAISYCAI